MPDLPWRLLIGAALFPLMLSGLYLRQVWAMAPGARRMLSIPLLIAALTLGAVGIKGVLIPGDPIMTGALELDAPLKVTLPKEPTALLIDGELPKTSVGREVSGDFEITLSGGTEEPITLRETLRKHYEDGGLRVQGAKTLVSETERRLDLPPALMGQTISITLTSTEGSLKPPLGVEVIPAPTDSNQAWIAMGILTLLGAILDQWGGRKTYFAPPLACIGAFAALLGGAVVPGGHIRFLFGVIIMATGAGLAVSGGLRILFAMVFGGGKKKPPRPKPPKPILE